MKPRFAIGDYVKWTGMGKQGKIHHNGIIKQIYSSMVYGKPCYRYKVEEQNPRRICDCSEGLLKIGNK